jgi:hypothetical protein
LRVAARATAENYSWDNIAGQYIDLLSEILEERKARHAADHMRVAAH